MLENEIARQLQNASEAASQRRTMLAKWGINTFLLICLAWIAWNARNAFPSVDDFCYAARAMKEGVLRSVQIEYTSWGGRYSATFLLSAFGQSRDLLLHRYYIVPLSVLLLNFLACAWLLRTFLIRPAAYLMPFFMVVLGMFSFRETIFWLAGAYTYGIAFALLIVLVTEEMRILADCLAFNPPPSWLRITVLSSASIVLAGFNETIMLAHIALLLALGCACLIAPKGGSHALRVAAVLGSAVLGAWIVRHAPGNLARTSTLAAPQLLPAIAHSLQWILERYILSFFITALLFYSSLLIYRPQAKIILDRTGARLAAGMLFFGLWAAMFARAYVLGDAGPARSQAVDNLLVSLLAFFTAWHVYTCDPEAARQGRRLAPILFSFVGLFLFCFMLRTGPDGLPLREVLGNMRYSRPLKAFMDERMKRAQTAGGQALALPDYPNKTRPVNYFDDIQQDPGDWRNACFASYFGLPEVRLEKLEAGEH